MVAHGLRIFNYCLPDGRDEEKREGGRDRRGGGGGGGACEQHIYICISTLHLVIRGKNPLPLEALHVLPIFPLHKHYKGDATHLFSLMGILNLPGQLTDRGELLRIGVDTNHGSVEDAGL